MTCACTGHLGVNNALTADVTSHVGGEVFRSFSYLKETYYIPFLCSYLFFVFLLEYVNML